MTRLELIATRGSKLNEANILKQLFMNKRFKEFVISENKFAQLAGQGIDAKGNSLSGKSGRGGYAPYTIEKKKLQSGIAAITDHITLYDTGDFYRSFKMEERGVTFGGPAFIITADTIKGDKDLMREWGPDILGLTNESIELVRDVALEVIIPIIRKQLFK